MVRSSCSYYNCGNSRRNNATACFFRFPKNYAVSKQWILNSGNKTLANVDEKDINNYVLCDKHFDVKSFKNSTRKQLNIDAVPQNYMKRAQQESMTQGVTTENLPVAADKRRNSFVYSTAPPPIVPATETYDHIYNKEPHIEMIKCEVFDDYREDISDANDPIGLNIEPPLTSPIEKISTSTALNDTIDDCRTLKKHYYEEKLKLLREKNFIKQQKLEVSRQKLEVSRQKVKALEGLRDAVQNINRL